LLALRLLPLQKHADIIKPPNHRLYAAVSLLPEVHDEVIAVILADNVKFCVGVLINHKAEVAGKLKV
jgi:hypothetical protein